MFFFFQAEDGIRDYKVTGVQTCALPIFIQEATVSDSRQSQISARYVATFREDFVAAESIARLDLAERRRPPIRLGAQLFLRSEERRVGTEWKSRRSPDD